MEISESREQVELRRGASRSVATSLPLARSLARNASWSEMNIVEIEDTSLSNISSRALMSKNSRRTTHQSNSFT